MCGVPSGCLFVLTRSCRAAGAYIHGSVGSGKSLLMDLLHSSAEQSLGLQHVRRMHFNAAMMEVGAVGGTGAAPDARSPARVRLYHYCQQQAARGVYDYTAPWQAVKPAAPEMLAT